MSIIGDWYDENYVIPMTKEIEEQKALLKECLETLENSIYEIQRLNLIKKLKSKLDIK